MSADNELEMTREKAHEQEGNAPQRPGGIEAAG